MMVRIVKTLLVAAVISCLPGSAFAGGGGAASDLNAGVCDEVKGATPGLYGLCVAFCEAQDCRPDWGAANPFADCRPSSPKLLRLYERRMQEGDPPMPCVQQAECPCYTREDLFEMSLPYDLCLDGYYNRAWGGGTVSAIYDWSYSPSYYRKEGLASHYPMLPQPYNCYYSNSTTGQVVLLSVDGDEYGQCVDMLAEQIDAGGCGRVLP